MKRISLPASVLRLLRFGRVPGNEKMSQALQIDADLGMVAHGNGYVLAATFISAFNQDSEIDAGVINLDAATINDSVASYAEMMNRILVQVKTDENSKITGKNAVLTYGVSNRKIPLLSKGVPVMAGAIDLTQPVGVSYLDANYLIQLGEHLKECVNASTAWGQDMMDVPIVEVRQMEGSTQFWFQDQDRNESVVVIAHIDPEPATSWIGMRPLGLPVRTLMGYIRSDHRRRQ